MTNSQFILYVFERIGKRYQTPNFHKLMSTLRSKHSTVNCHPLSLEYWTLLFCVSLTLYIVDKCDLRLKYTGSYMCYFRHFKYQGYQIKLPVPRFKEASNMDLWYVFVVSLDKLLNK